MPALGWLWVDDVEVLNNGRLLANLECVIGGLQFSTFDDPCPGMSRDPNNSWAALDYSSVTAAPWYDSGVPYSDEFLGFHVETFLFNSPIQRSVTERGTVRGGANVGRLRRTHREIELELLLVATSDAGLQYGIDWLARQFAPSDVCATHTVLMRLSCPEVGSETTDLWELREVGILDGPEWGDSPFSHAGCIGRRASLTIVAGEPCRYFTVGQTLANATTTPLNTDGDCGTASTPLDFICPPLGLPRQRVCAQVPAPGPIGQTDVDVIVDAGDDGAAATLVRSAYNPLELSYLDGLDGTAGKYAAGTTLTDLNTISGTLSLLVYARADDWEPATEMLLTGFADAAGFDAAVTLTTSGTLKAYVRDAGGTLRSRESSQPVVLGDGEGRWVGCIITDAGASGTVTFYVLDAPADADITLGELTEPIAQPDAVLGEADLTITGWNGTWQSSTSAAIGGVPTLGNNFAGRIYQAIAAHGGGAFWITDVTDETPGATTWADLTTFTWTAAGAGVEISAADKVYACGNPQLTVDAEAVICRLEANERVWIDSANRKVWYDPGTGVWEDGTSKLSLDSSELDRFFHFYGSVDGLVWTEPADLRGHSTTAAYTISTSTKVCD